MDDMNDFEYFDGEEDAPVKKLTRVQLAAQRAKNRKRDAAARKERQRNTEKILGQLRKQLIGGDYEIRSRHQEMRSMQMRTIYGGLEIIPTGQITITLECHGPLKVSKPKRKKPTV